MIAGLLVPCFDDEERRLAALVAALVNVEVCPSQFDVALAALPGVSEGKITLAGIAAAVDAATAKFSEDLDAADGKRVNTLFSYTPIVGAAKLSYYACIMPNTEETNLGEVIARALRATGELDGVLFPAPPDFCVNPAARAHLHYVVSGMMEAGGIEPWNLPAADMPTKEIAGAIGAAFEGMFAERVTFAREGAGVPVSHLS